MSNNAKRIPSINLPLTNEQGTMHPIWYEFFRSFISGLDADSGNGGGGSTVEAGAGLTSDGDILAVGAGAGIKVNADDVAVDITGQVNAQAAMEDELLISDASASSATRKTSIQSIVALASLPGGDNTHVQYNAEGVFGGNAAFTTDGVGSATLSNTLTVGSIVMDGGAVDTVFFDGTSGAGNAHIQSDGSGGYSLYADTGNANSYAVAYFKPSGPPYLTLDFGSSATMTMANTVSGGTGIKLAGQLPLCRCIKTAVTASTTQTQGNGALTGDYNLVNVVANANDTVTLPAALEARYCLVRNSGANILKIFPASGDDLGAGVDTSITLQPGNHYEWFAIDTTTWHQTAGVQRQTVASGITASTTQTQGQQPLTKDVNEISVVANVNDTVTLPTAPAYSRTVTIINNGASTLKIFPASGDNLGPGIDASTTLAAGSNVQFVNYDNTNWEIV